MFSLLQLCQHTLLFKEESWLLPSMINLILNYLAKVRDINKDMLGMHLRATANFCVVHKAFAYYYEPKKSCYIYSVPWHINRCISSYKGKQITFSRKQEGKKIEGNRTPVFTEKVLFWIALFLVSIFDSNYSFWFLPLS